MATSMNLPVPPQRNRTRWWIPLAIIAALLGGIVLGMVLLVVLVVVAISSAGSVSFTAEEEPTVREHSILVLNFPDGIREQQYPPGLFATASTPSMLDVISAIRYAAQDSKVDGILLRNCRGVGFTKSREIRQELEEFKKSGKWIYAFLDRGTEADYYLASVADSIFVAPLGMMEFNGLGVAVPFFKGISDKLGITWTVVQREEYKSAGEQFSRSRFSEPARQELREVLQQYYRTFVADVARTRRLPQENLDQLLNAGIYRAEEFVQRGLADVIATELQVRDFLRQRSVGQDSTKKLRIVRPAMYARYARSQTASSIERDKAIAIIGAVGTIRSGKSMGEANEIASLSLCQDIRKAADDTTIKAIILRIESGGGSAQASEEIWQELQRARTKKPVYASLSSVAASGGYYIAAGCDTIIAAPETITGSIGVIAAIPNFSKMMNSIGVTFDTVRTNPNALFLNGVLPVTPTERRVLEQMIDSTYARFLARVAESRHRSVDAIRTVARGRIWTGTAAQARGLVDVVGGLTDAIELAKRRIGIPPDKRPRLKFYPEKEDFAAIVMRLIRRYAGEEDEDDAMVRSLNVSHWRLALESIAGKQTYQEVTRALGITRLARRERILALMPVELRL